MPGVEVDSEGKITVNGKEVKKVMVDGKEFFSDDPKVASKNLPAKMIDKLQVLDKKSDMAQITGFDDGEEETVINLTVKPGMKQGWFGNAYGGYACVVQGQRVLQRRQGLEARGRRPGGQRAPGVREPGDKGRPSRALHQRVRLPGGLYRPDGEHPGAGHGFLIHIHLHTLLQA